jgi:hypothetical protein
MAETIVSPGVLAIENDQSFITQQPITAGAAIIGPTVKGKVGIPTIVTTYSQYQNKYGDTFLSGSNTYTYFTSISAYNYFNNGGTSLLVTRVVGEDFTSATSSIIYNDQESGVVNNGTNLLNSFTSGGEDGAVGTYSDIATTTSGTGTGVSLDIVTSTLNGNLPSTPDNLLPEISPNPTNAGSGSYTSVALTGGSGSGAQATVEVTGSTAPTISSITVTSTGSGYVVGDILTISSGSLGVGQLIYSQSILNISNGASLNIGTANTGSLTTASFSSVTSGSHQSGSGGNVAITTSQNGQLLTTSDILLNNINSGSNPTNAGSGSYTSVALTGGSGSGAEATVVVTGTTAPTITGITVTSTGSGYVAGDILTISSGSLGVGQLIYNHAILPQSNGASLSMGTASIATPIIIPISSVSGGSQQSGTGGSIQVYTTQNGKLFTTPDILLNNINSYTNPTNAGVGTYTGVSLIDFTGTGIGAEATVVVTGTTAPTITGITVTSTGSGYVAGDIVIITSGSLGVGQLINADDITSDSSLPTIGTYSTPTEVAQSSTSGAGAGATFTITGDGVNAISTVVVTSIGTGYVLADTITITQTDLISAGFTGALGDLVITVSAAMVQDSDIAYLALTESDIDTTVASVTAHNIGTNYVVNNVLTILQADLIAAGFLGATGDLTITLAGSGFDIQDSNSSTFTLTPEDINTTISALTVNNIGTNYVTNNVLTILQADLIAAGFLGATGDLTITLTPSNVQDSSAATITLTGSNFVGEISSITVQDAGTGYAVGDTLTVALASMGSPSSDLVLTLVDADIEDLSSFTLETLSEGEIMNSTGPAGTSGTLLSGSADNFRWQIVNANTSSGTFSLLIRQGSDSNITPSILETWGPLSLDPFSNNYIEKVIGNQSETVASDDGEYYIQLSGNYPNLSSYVRVKQVNQSTPNYFDNVGTPKPEYTGSIPINGSGSFGSAEGKNVPTGVVANYYENIISENNIQGLPASAYTESISLLANKDAFNYNVLTAPGLLSDMGGVAYAAINNMINTAQNRGDMMVVFDSSKHSSQISTVLNNTAGYDTSYAATYWPWVKTIDPSTANQVWVPASTMIPGVYAFNDNVAAPWFAPAGINRGILTTSTQSERVLTQGNRDTLYQSNVNPISTFPNVGVVIFGQKTLQRRSSSLDRINVRRLLIELKGYISQIADTFVFEQNDTVTRNDFLASINPYLNSVQQQQGLTAFRVIMDETNNPPNVVDNNQLIGQIYLQPTRTAEFILLDFNILPTGATFPS